MPNLSKLQPKTRSFALPVETRHLGVEYYREEFDRLYPVFASDKECWKAIFALSPTIDDPEIIRRAKKHKASLSISRTIVETMVQIIEADPEKKQLLRTMQRQKLTA